MPTQYDDPHAPEGTVSVVHRHIYFYCDVTSDTVQEFVAHFKNLEIEGLVQAAIYEIAPLPIHLHIFSPGGEIHAGLLAADLIRSSRVPVHTYVDGACASAATLMSCAGTRRFISPSSMMLVHQMSAMIEGKHDDVRDAMANTEKMADLILAVYHRVVPADKQSYLQDLLRREVMLSAQECLDLGLVDEIR